MKRITILSGHYGSGKSEIAVNLALDYKLNYLVDLDIVNPYFRSRSVRELLTAHGVTLIESTLENVSGSDLPFINAKGSRPFVNRDLTAVYDLGGTKLGAKVLIQFKDFISTVDDIDFLVVVNIFRPETQTAEQIIKTIEDLEGGAQMRVTGLINNTNLMNETEESMILEGEKVLKEVSEHLNIPIKYTFIEEKIHSKLSFAGEERTLVRHLAKKWL